MSKICTDKNQSKKLLELGVDVNTADMWYQHIGYSIIDGKEKLTYFPMVIRDNISDDDIPAWSLAALLDVLPKNYGRYTKSLYWFDDGWHCEYVDQNGEGYVGKTANNPVDACYKMILKLNELNLL